MRSHDPVFASYARPVRSLALAALCALLATGSIGCAYFNTYHHAKKFFGEAERSHREELQTGVEGQSRSAAVYKQCIDKCAKLIERYPGSKWQDDATLLMARSFYGRGEYPSARRELSRFAERFPGSGLRPEAEYWNGMTAFAQGDFADATGIWNALLEERPDFEHKEDVRYHLALAAKEEKDDEAALAALTTFLDEYPKGDRAWEARLALANVLMDMDRYEDAEALFAEVSTRSPVEVQRREAAIRRGEALEIQGRLDEAHGLYVQIEQSIDSRVFEGRITAEEREAIRVAELEASEAAKSDSLFDARFQNGDSTRVAGDLPPVVPDPSQEEDPFAEERTDPGMSQGNIDIRGQGTVTPLGTRQNQRREAETPGALKRRDVNNPALRDLARLMLHEGTSLAKLNRPWEAILAYEQVISEFAGTPYASEAQYRIGYTYEVYLEDFEAAQKSYDKVGSHGKSSFSEDATRRSKSLSDMRARTAVTDTTGSDAIGRFMKAELYLFQQDKAEKALEEYRAIETDFAGTETAAKAGLAVGYVLIEALQDTARGRAKYAEVMRDYPETEYGRRARRILQGPDREPEVEDFDGPPVELLRDPENLASIAERDSLLAAADAVRAKTVADSLAAATAALQASAENPQEPGMADSVRVSEAQAGLLAERAGRDPGAVSPPGGDPSNLNPGAAAAGAVAAGSEPPPLSLSPEELRDALLPRGPSGQPLDPFVVPKDGFTPVLESVSPLGAATSAPTAPAVPDSIPAPEAVGSRPDSTEGDDS